MNENTSKSSLDERVVHFRLNDRLKGYIYRQNIYTNRQGNGSTTSKKLCSKLFSTEFEFYLQKRQIRFFSHPLGELGVMYALHL